MADGRVLHATLDLLDRQLRDRNGRLCGNVDDLELTFSDTGELYVTGLHSHIGALVYRLGGRRAGSWLRSANRRLHDVDADRTVIPIVLAYNIGPSIDVAVDAIDLATSDTERWVRDHIICHIPGSASRADQ